MNNQEQQQTNTLKEANPFFSAPYVLWWSKKQLLDFQTFLNKYDLSLNVNYNYLQCAFIHPTFSHDNQINYNYQRLEFLGDSLIGKEVSIYLFNKPELTEKDMTNERIKMVDHDALCQVAKDLNFKKFILVGASYRYGDEDNETEEISPANYEDIFEAFCAAIYLTYGQETLTKFINKTLIHYYENNKLNISFDYKTKFQEAMQRYGKADIKYATVETHAEHSNKHLFHTQVKYQGIVYGEGEGYKKHEAENEAAKDALAKMCTNEQ